jgi:hypothetical protein
MADVNVTATLPPGAFTLKGTDAAWRTPPIGAGTVPGSVSETSVGEVVVDDDELEPPHPTHMPTVTNKARAENRFRCFMAAPEESSPEQSMCLHNNT